ncbi:MAG: HAMP domain-containing protein [Loktanella sp.]|nr:HAMP domain-containing protein [Loktanella sp.]
MRKLNAIPFSLKLPVIIAGLCLLSSLTVAVLGYADSRRSMVTQAQHSFDILIDERGQALENLFATLEIDLRNLVASPATLSAAQALGSSFHLMTDPASLQAAYGANNPNPMGQRHLLDQAAEALPYNFQHGAFHPGLRLTLETTGFDDIFLVSPDGDVIYSVTKAADFASNLETGTFRETGLGHAFRAARDGGRDAFSFTDFAPYGPRGNDVLSFLSAQILNAEGGVAGVLAVQLSTSQFDAILNNASGLGATGLLYLVGTDGRTRSHTRFADGHTLLQDVSHLPHILANDAGKGEGVVGNGIGGAASIVERADVSGLDRDWRIIGEKTLAEVLQPVVAMRNKMILISAVVMVIAILLGVATARSVLLPLDRLRLGMLRVADRDYSGTVSDTDRGDELGQLSKVLVNVRDKLRASDAAEQERQKVQVEQAEVVERLSRAMIALVDGDLTATIDRPFSESYEQLRHDYNRTVANLNETIGSVVSSAVGIRERANEMSSASDDLSRRTENQAATLEQTAAALDQLTASVRSAASGAKEVEGIVADARKDADASGPVVQKAVTAMTAIEKSSDEISQIVGVIDDIAFQTNLLALNAGVEAARAGDAGRGFAVVASEVRALAQRSSEAAKQIKSLIAGSSDQVVAGVNLVGQAGDVLTNIASHINHIAGLVSEIAAGAQEQSTGLAEINLGVTQLDKVTQQNAAMVEQSTASSHSLNAESASLADLVAQFQLGGVKTRRAGMTASVSENVMMFQSPRSRVQQAKPVELPLVQPIAMTGTLGGAPVHNTDGWEDF